MIFSVILFQAFLLEIGATVTVPARCRFVLPAFTCLRLSRDTGQPLRAGASSGSGDVLHTVLSPPGFWSNVLPASGRVIPSKKVDSTVRPCCWPSNTSLPLLSATFSDVRSCVKKKDTWPHPESPSKVDAFQTRWLPQQEERQDVHPSIVTSFCPNIVAI